MNESCSSDCKVTEPSSEVRKEHVFFVETKSTRRQTVRGEMQHFESFSNDKYNQ